MAGEAPGGTGTIQDKIIIWAAHQPVKNEPVVGFSTPQENTSYKGLEDHAETQNVEVVRNSVSFLKRVKTQNFKIGLNPF
jgi:hypothetical protein